MKYAKLKLFYESKELINLEFYFQAISGEYYSEKCSRINFNIKLRLIPPQKQNKFYYFNAIV